MAVHPYIKIGAVDSVSDKKYMDKKTIKESSFARASQWPGAMFIDNDILLIESPGMAPFPHNARQMSFILMALCTQGAASYTVDTVEYKVKTGDVVIIGDGHIVDNFAPSNDLDGLCMMISVDYFSEIISNVTDFSSLLLISRMHPVVHLSTHEMEVFESYYHLICDKMRDAENHYRRDVVRTLILAMFYDMGSVIYRELKMVDGLQSRAYSIFTRFIKLVEAHHRHERRVSWYAQQLCITSKYLSETVKAVSLVTPNEWIDRYVVLEIRLLLKRSDKSIKEIAEELLFPNQSFMGKFFKEHTGLSPSQYRRV